MKRVTNLLMDTINLTKQQETIWQTKDNPFKSFWGNDQDYGYPYNHRYDESDSDRGASDEGWKKPNTYFKKRGMKLW